ncbi:MAG: hypothetical protein LBL83_04890 [Clostridiales bacterium]|jgi:hypothetical protein|nr:hypothetical protein [Clostridiales bacterium]
MRLRCASAGVFAIFAKYLTTRQISDSLLAMSRDARASRRPKRLAGRLRNGVWGIEARGRGEVFMAAMQLLEEKLNAYYRRYWFSFRSFLHFRSFKGYFYFATTQLNKLIEPCCAAAHS